MSSAMFARNTLSQLFSIREESFPITKALQKLKTKNSSDSWKLTLITTTEDSIQAHH